MPNEDRLQPPAQPPRHRLRKLVVWFVGLLVCLAGVGSLARSRQDAGGLPGDRTRPPLGPPAVLGTQRSSAHRCTFRCRQVGADGGRALAAPAPGSEKNRVGAFLWIRRRWCFDLVFAG